MLTMSGQHWKQHPAARRRGCRESAGGRVHANSGGQLLVFPGQLLRAGQPGPADQSGPAAGTRGKAGTRGPDRTGTSGPGGPAYSSTPGVGPPRSGSTGFEYRERAGGRPGSLGSAAAFNRLRPEFHFLPGCLGQQCTGGRGAGVRRTVAQTRPGAGCWRSRRFERRVHQAQGACRCEGHRCARGEWGLRTP